MTTLIIYQSIEGQTGKIVDAVKRQLTDAGHDVRCFDAGDKLAPLSFKGVSMAVLAAPVHERRHPKNFEVAIASSAKELAQIKTLLLSVSLKAAFPEGIDEAEAYLVEMKMRTGFEPNSEMLVAGAIRPGSYDYYQSQVLANVVLEGQDVASGNEVHEFTDWAELRTAIDEFIR